MNKSYLSRITKDLTSGRPLWALLYLNEITSIHDPLRRAFVRKARAIIQGNIKLVPHAYLIERIFAGALLGELPEDSRSVIRTLEGYSRKERNGALPRPVALRERALARMGIAFARGKRGYSSYPSSRRNSNIRS